MTGTSAAGILVMVVVIVLGLLALVLSVFVWGRGSWKHRRIDRTPGDSGAGPCQGPRQRDAAADAPANSIDGSGQ